MEIRLSDHFSYRRLLRFVMPSIFMMIFTSIYGIVDGIFISNCVGSNALSSINIIMPPVMIVGAVGFMLGTGGCAEVSRALGEGRSDDARRYFTTLIFTIIGAGVLLSAAIGVFIRPIAYLLGASELLIEDCVTYGGITLFGSTFFMLQTSFHTFFVAAEKPKIGLSLTIASGVANMVLDYLFVYVLDLGVAGAAWATVVGYMIGGVIPFVYFCLPNSSLLRFTKTKLYGRMLLRSCLNGSSEMVSNLSMSIVTILYNLQMMKIVGEDGVAAFTVIMYVNFIFIAILIGFTIGTAPIISYNYGANNVAELKNVFKKSAVFVCITSVLMVIAAQVAAFPIVSIFVNKNPTLAEMALHGFRLYSLSFLVCGISIFGSSFFTALCNGKVSAVISFMHSFILPVIMIMTLPIFLGIDGLWLSEVFSSAISAAFTLMFVIILRKKYKYL